MRTFKEFINESYDENSLNENKKVAGSKIGTYFKIIGDEIIFGFKYKHPMLFGPNRGVWSDDGTAAEELEFFSDESIEDEVGDINAYVKDLKNDLAKAYSLLNVDTETIQKFIGTIGGGLFGSETYNGWMYMDQVGDKKHINTGDPKHSVTFETLLYIISKIEAFLAYRELNESEAILERYDNFYPILSIGAVNVASGKSKYFNIYDTYGGDDTTVEIYKNKSKLAFVLTSGVGPLSNSDGSKPKVGDMRSFKHDQTGRPLFFGEFVDSVLLKDLKNYGIKSATGYVYK